ncbi:hypothetical protein CRUP_001663 [Coryphaenoides rupestris]|nr:hypothetical protein CRUP_001663 [Coryphaenoides rupestris]
MLDALLLPLQEDLKAWVTGNLTACARSIFIFDEMERIAGGVAGVRLGEDVINKVALRVPAGRAGTERRSSLLTLSPDIAHAVSNTDSGGGFSGSNIINDGLVTRFVPFLPLCRHHVQRCVRDQLCQQGMCGRTDVVDAVVGDMHYTPAQGQYFSTTGCKSVPAKINFFL